MGIARFYRWLAERYPLINENIATDQIPEFDNLYLDMNGIIHNCSHNNTGGLHVKSEDDVWVEVFKYISRLFQIIRPKKLMYMAVDGNAPRAKMNQQRSRRFRAANEAREAREKAAEMGEEIAGTPFDSNCITPGTEFMARLTQHLRFFVQKKIQEDPLWQGCTIVVSGPEVPGEGEHKIMDYIRCMKSQKGYDPNTRHCLYGLDADLIMLALASHEPHFALLREEVTFGRATTQSTDQRMMFVKERFQLLHISLLREYLDMEFAPAAGSRLSFTYDSERAIDDFVLFCVLVGNDFLPHMPFAEIGEGGLADLFNLYKQHMRESNSAQPWLTTDCGEVVWPQLRLYLQRYALIEGDKLQSAVDDQSFALGKRRTVGPEEAPAPNILLVDGPVDMPPTVELARVQWYDIKFKMDVETHAGTQEQRDLFHSYLEGIQWVMFYYFRGPDQASWSWYYPYYYAPMVADLVNYDKFDVPEIAFERGEPFKPFQQLMAVLPSSSKVLLPKIYHWLFDMAESPIVSFYPQKFDVDIDGVKVPWGGMTLIPWIDPALLLKTMASVEEADASGLSEAERIRNSFGTARSFTHDREQAVPVKSTLPKTFGCLNRCPVRAVDFRHPLLPSGVVKFPNHVLTGCNAESFGFPTLKRYPLTLTFENGVKVFNFESRGQSLVLHLHPTGPITPSEEAIQKLLKASCAQIDYPCVHRGKVVAVHTAYSKIYSNGQIESNNAKGHENTVQWLCQDHRRKGLTVDFESAPADAAAGRGARCRQGGPGDKQWQQPVVEVQALESTYVDDEGVTQYRFKSETQHRLLHLVRAEAASPSRGPRSLAERFPLHSSVICIAKDSEYFGQVGHIEKNVGDASALQGCFERGFTREEQVELQHQMQRIVEHQHATLKWHELGEVASLAGLALPVVRQIFGSLMVRCADNVQEDCGMNFILDRQGNCHCLPAFSMKSPSSWWFSDLAVTALKDYMEKFPTLFEVLKWRRPDDRKPVEMRDAFRDAPDVAWAAGKLVKYINKQSFKKLYFAPPQYMALTDRNIQEVLNCVDALKRRAEKRPPLQERMSGTNSLYRAEDLGSRRPSELFPATDGDDILIGQRGIYIKPLGCIACGAKCTVTAVYGQSHMQDLELVLDDESLGANGLHGRAPTMRGIQVPAATFLPLFPRLQLGTLAPKPTPVTDELFADVGTTSGTGDAEDVAEVLPAFDSEASTTLLNLLKQPQPSLTSDAVHDDDAPSRPLKSSKQPMSSSTNSINKKLIARLVGAPPVPKTPPEPPRSFYSAGAVASSASSMQEGQMMDLMRQIATPAADALPMPAFGAGSDALPMPAFGAGSSGKSLLGSNGPGGVVSLGGASVEASTVRGGVAEPSNGVLGGGRGPNPVETCPPRPCPYTDSRKKWDAGTVDARESSDARAGDRNSGYSGRTGGHQKGGGRGASSTASRSKGEGAGKGASRGAGRGASVGQKGRQGSRPGAEERADERDRGDAAPSQGPIGGAKAKPVVSQNAEMWASAFDDLLSLNPKKS